MSDAAPNASTPSAVPAARPPWAWWARLNSGLDRWLSEVVERHVVAAFVMVAISMLGAVAAYRVGLAEQRSIALERRLAHGQLQDIGFRQEFLSEVLFRIGLNNTENRLKRDATELRVAYKALERQSAAAANWLEWRAAELMLQRNAIQQFSAHLRTLEALGKTVEEELADLSAQALRAQGFLAAVDESAKERSAVKFPSLHAAIVASHEISASLSWCVLVFVFGLVCLTLAELGIGPAIAWVVLVGAGVASAAGATGAALRIDPGAAWTMVPLILVLAVAGVLATRFGLFRMPHDRSHAPHPEAPEPARVSFAHMTGHSSQDPWSRAIVLFITAAVFVSAVFGWVYSDSLKHAGHFALEAQEKKTEVVNQRARLSAVALGGTFDASIEILTRRIRCASATQFAALVDEGMIDADSAAAESERGRRCKELDAYVKGRDYFVEMLDEGNLADSSSRAAKRMLDLVIDRERGPELTLALSDGYAEISVGWSKRAALLLAVLTILAIALYLFGQAYTMGRTVAGRWLIRSGATLLGVSILLGVFAWMRPIVEQAGDVVASCPAEPADDHADKADAREDVKHDVDEATRLTELAAAQYAEGMRQYNIAGTAPRGSQERADADAAAAKSFTCAIAARPGFISAYQRLAWVISRADSPQRGESSYLSLYSRTRLAEFNGLQLRELKALTNAGMLRPLNQLGNYAFAATMIALADGKPAALGEARTALDMITGSASWRQRLYTQWMRPELWSEELPSRAPTDVLNLGLTQLATGEPEQLARAADTYDRALNDPPRWSPKALTVNLAGFNTNRVECRHVRADGKRCEPTFADWTPDLLASALTDLEVLRAYCRRLHRDEDTCTRVLAAVDRVRPLIAAGAPAGALPADSTASAQDFTVAVTPYSLRWSARLRNFDRKCDRLTFAFFRDDRQRPGEAEDSKTWQVRRALPDFFEMYTPGGRRLPAADAAGATVHEVQAIDVSRRCIDPGRYDAELFLNGKMVATKSVTVDQHTFAMFRSRELDLNWCAPKEWLPWSGSTTRHPWFRDRPVRGFVMRQDDGAGGKGKANLQLGGAMLTFFAPASLANEMREAYFLRRTFQILTRKGEVDGGWSQTLEDRLLRSARSVDRLSEAECRASATVVNPVYRYFADKSEKSLIHIGIVGGSVTGRDACVILKSLGNFF